MPELPEPTLDYLPELPTVPEPTLGFGTEVADLGYAPPMYDEIRKLPRNRRLKTLLAVARAKSEFEKDEEDAETEGITLRWMSQELNKTQEGRQALMARMQAMRQPQMEAPTPSIGQGVSALLGGLRGEKAGAESALAGMRQDSALKYQNAMQEFKRDLQMAGLEYESLTDREKSLLDMLDRAMRRRFEAEQGAIEREFKAGESAKDRDLRRELDEEATDRLLKGIEMRLPSYEERLAKIENLRADTRSKLASAAFTDVKGEWYPFVVKGQLDRLRSDADYKKAMVEIAKGNLDLALDRMTAEDRRFWAKFEADEAADLANRALKEREMELKESEGSSASKTIYETEAKELARLRTEYDDLAEKRQSAVIAKTSESVKAIDALIKNKLAAIERQKQVVENARGALEPSKKKSNGALEPSKKKSNGALTKPVARIRDWASQTGLPFQGYNQRNIAGSTTPSQHSYGNAADVFPKGAWTLEKIAQHWAGKPGVSRVIVKDMVWDKARGWHKGKNIQYHGDHVHIEGETGEGSPKPPKPSPRPTADTPKPPKPSSRPADDTPKPATPKAASKTHPLVLGGIDLMKLLGSKPPAKPKSGTVKSKSGNVRWRFK